MDLTGLPQFTVMTVSALAGGHEIGICGRFSHLRGVRNARGWLYRDGELPIIGDLETMPSSPGTECVFRSPDVERLPALSAGDVFPWLDGYWQSYHLDMILAPAESWTRRSFVSEAARYFRLDGVTGWQPADQPLPSGAIDMGVREGAWDHEHCEICERTIGAGGEAEGYQNPADHWLCAACHAHYAVTHDLSFTTED